MTTYEQQWSSALAAPEIDRLVWAVNTRTRRDHGDEFAELAATIGIDVIFPLDHYAAFLLAGRLTRELAVDRMRYMARDRVLAQIDGWKQAGLVDESGGVLTASATIRPLLDVLRTRRTEVASAIWSGHPAEVDETSALARRVIDGSPDSLSVAVAHRELPDPSDRFLLLHQRLVTLRYVRQEAHANAWLARDLDAPQIMAMTELWHGEATTAAPGVIAALEAAGYVVGDPGVLTPNGLEMRQSIEADTNTGTQPAFDALSDDEFARFLDLLRALPGEPV